MVEPEEWRIDSEVFGEPQDRQPALGGGREQPVDVLQFQAAIVERAPDSLRHQIEDGETVGHLAKVGFRDADDGRAAAFEPFHHALSTGAKTG